MKICTLAYIPPPNVGNAAVFVENLRKFPTAHPLVAYSDHDYGSEVIRLKGSPELARDTANPFAINNACFYTGVRIADKQGYDYFCYLEADCRVGRKHWDAAIFDEFFADPRALICGGSVVVYNPSNSGPVGFQKWCDLCALHNGSEKNSRIPTYGWKGAADASGSCVFVNGALGVYSVAWMKLLFPELFEEGKSLEVARKSKPWDLQIGLNLWSRFGADAYELVGHMSSMFSSYGDVLTTEQQRLDWLREGRYVAIHQVKSSATL